MSLSQEVKHYILENYLFTEDESVLANDDSFLEKGILDSTGILEVIYFIEDTYNITVDDVDMVPENLDSIERLDVFIKRKQAKA